MTENMTHTQSQHSTAQNAAPEQLSPEQRVPDLQPLAEPCDQPLPPPAAAGALHLAVSAVSDIGCVRTNNEDNFGYDESLGIYIICDGMGGMASGEVASARAVSAMLHSYKASEQSGLPVSTRLLQAINTANNDVWQHGSAPEHKGMGTTIVVAALDGDKLVIGNVGDSRAYMLQGTQIAQLTVDHSYINELIRNGTLTLENAHSADLQGMENVITRAIGVSADVQPDFFSVDLHSGTNVLLATDGLTRYVLQDEIAQVLTMAPFDSICHTLIDCAKQRGGHDNITCLLLRTQLV